MPRESSFQSMAQNRKSIRSLVRENAAQRREQIKGNKALKRLRRRYRDYEFKNVTTQLASTPGALEVHPTRGAPTVAEVRDDLLREKEKARMKFFGVPVKIYEHPTEDGISLPESDLTEEEREEINRYGSRVVMNKAGHVIALEVRKDVMKRFKPKVINADFCQCQTLVFDMSESLKHHEGRRMFMIRVLVIETLMKFPTLVWLCAQEFIPSCYDGFYDKKFLILTFYLIIFLMRAIIVLFTQLINNKIVQRILLLLTSLSYCLGFSFATSFALQWYVYWLEINQYEDPVSVETLNIKMARHVGGPFYPYSSTMLVAFFIGLNFVLIVFLLLPHKIMNEMKNGPFLVIFLTQIVFSIFCYILIFIVRLVPNPIPWDALQIVVATMASWKWEMWRFYMLQELLRGRLHDIYDHQYVIVVLEYAFTFN